MIMSFKRNTCALLFGLLALSACRPINEFTVVHGGNSAILERLTRLLSVEGFKPISQFSPDPRANGCRVIDEDGAFEKQTHSHWTTRWFSVTYLVCDGHLRFDVRSAQADTSRDGYQGKLVELLRHEFEGEIAAGQLVVKTKQNVEFGP
jgi:hypothetical protein